MTSYIRRVYIISLLILVAAVAHAQRFANISLEGAQTVCAITQDAQGMMWVGTDNGLFSFDGYHGYRHYQEHAFSNTRVNALAFEGNLLYMATGNGILKFDTHADTYWQTTTVTNYNDPAKRKAVKELRVLDLKSKNARYEGDVYALLHTPKGLLQGKMNGLYLNGRRLALAAGTQPLVNALAYDARRHCYWIGTEGALYCADTQLRNFSKIAALDGNSVKCLAEEANGNLYIGTDNGLYVMALNNAIAHYTHDSRNAASIPNNIVWACFVDKWQNVWIGTDNGLSRLSTHTYYNYVSLDKITFSGEGNCLHAILQTRNGEWWMGGTNGLIRFRQGGATEDGGIGYQDVAWYKQNNQAFPLTHNRVRKIFEDRDGDVWICTDHGINLYDRNTHQMRNFIVYDKTGKYSTAWAYDILQDHKGRLWMASYMGGIFIMDKQELLAGKTIADIHLTDQGKNALSGLHVGQMVLDGNGLVWASTYNRLDCINPTSLKVMHVDNADVINYMMADSKGNVWVGDNSAVRCYYASIPMQGSKFDAKEWKIGGKVSTMCDVEGTIWAITGNECCVLDPEGDCRRFMIPDVMPLNVCYSKLTHEVVMGGNDGFVTVHADVIKRMSRQGKLLLAGVVVNGKQTQEDMLDVFADADETLNPREAKKLVLDCDENNFVVQLTDLPFADHPSAVYAYQLEGSDHDWHYLKKGNLDIAYNGLSYGDYRLTVHLVDGEGKIGEEVYSLDISVLPPWYLSIWAKIFYLTALVVFVAWVVNSYLARKQLMAEQKQKAEVLEQVQARMQFYTTLADKLKAAVAHQSFDEVNNLIHDSLDVDVEVSPKELTATVPVSETTAQAASETSDEETAHELGDLERRQLEEITKAIEEHMVDSDFNVTSLQKVVGMGNKQLYRKVKALTGQTPVEYIRDMRLHKAAKLLRAGKFSVSEVMYMVGFSNSSYFSKCFSKSFGMTPSEYIKNSK